MLLTPIKIIVTPISVKIKESRTSVLLNIFHVKTEPWDTSPAD